jgi:hypothetical protein
MMSTGTQGVAGAKQKCSRNAESVFGRRFPYS